MVCYKKYLKHLVNLAWFWYSLVKMQTYRDLRFKIKAIGLLRITQSPSPSGTEKRLRLWLKRQKYPISPLGSFLGSQSLFLFRSVFSYSIFVANVDNEYWSPGAFQTLVPRSAHKWSAKMSWKHGCRWFYIYVHTYIDQNTGKNISSWAELISVLIVIVYFSPSIFSSPGHNCSWGWAGAENNYPISGANCGFQLGSQLTWVKKLITVNSSVRNKIFSCDPPWLIYLFIYNKTSMVV